MKIGKIAFKPYDFPMYIKGYIQDVENAENLLKSLDPKS